ncbi:hypothetical protein [Actinomadura hibisca]|uniref:hypothetical protein n=1 Tax=Actinomadura hibisca TaxID=68565 RepID=UPI000AD90EB5|nr:hypothetical protein [Actinomadura hibisca]
MGAGSRVSPALTGGQDRKEVDAMRQNLDLRVQDRVALDEIELYAEMLSAVAEADKPLTLAEIDMVLGVDSADSADRALTRQD